MKYFFITLFLLLTSFTFSQNKTKEDVKIGLVLSGGGAKGLAHIGVLKVIDSLGIRVDYVAGTSMGAIVGSLYASGYSGKQIDSIFKDVNFDKIINDDLPRAAKTFYERENSEKYAITLPFEHFNLKLPSALSRGQNTLSLLSKLTLHVSDVEDFSKLPIPFFCIATNVETGQAVVLDKGNLPQAITASGAFPSLFQPVNIDGQLLIDGGVVNNYPIDELRAKGMDLIIGVDVQDDLASRDNLKSAPAILLQINNYRTINDMKVKSKKTDIYIKPDITDFTVVSFSDGREIINNGEKAATKEMDALKHVASMQTKTPKKPLVIKPVDSIHINAIFIKGNEKYTDAYVLGKLKFKQDVDLKYSRYVEGVNNLAATNNFESVVHKLMPSNNGEGYDMYVTLKESTITTFFRLGVHYDDLYKTAALLNLTKKQLLIKNDVLSFDFIVGDNIRYNFEYYVDQGFYWSVGLKSNYNQFKKVIPAAALLSEEELQIINVNKLDVAIKDLTNQFYLQTLFTKDMSLTLGAEHKRLNITTETILTGDNEKKTTFENSDYLSLFGKAKYDSYDNKYFPNEGVYFNGDFHLYLYSSDFNNNFSEFSIAKATIGYAYSFTDKLSANITTQGGFNIGENDNPYLNFTLGGYGNDFINNFEAFYGYDFISISGNSFVKGVLSLDYEIFKKNHINIAANYSNIANDIFDDGEWITSPDYSGYAIGYSLETIVGPIELKYTYSPETNDSIWFFNLGFWF
ncbi:patatin-like phospholipase family protein [Xanthomarina sp. F2636L]|uniref:patatin-like phospholipase family protein n=1 Tax=Xanthomarina sp. F2636L TaxID=2996018 RepID=UPI00225E5F1B|nr:patatin-like phospholipase family protein [Xanthomarina sp. F2636L]MCX7551111.1 patatin-like phospholipase family protein [Xanthomarina sp. F2636L]